MCEVIVCGILCNNDIALAELLSRYGFSVRIIRLFSQKAIKQEELPGCLKYFSYDNIIYVKNSLQFIHECSKSKLVISINGYYPSMIGLKAKIFSLITRKKPIKVINLTCGSDITEFVVGKSKASKKYKKHLEHSSYNYISPYPYAVKNILKISLKNFSFYRFNCYLLNKCREVEKNNENEPLIFFHASNLDWGYNDSEPGRNSTKGNDKFLRAFFRACDDGLKAKCIILDRGPDKEQAKNIINQSKYAHCFEFKPQLTPKALGEILSKSDVIVDQFDVGALGGITCEAMAQAKPVMIYIDKNCWPLVYDEEPPVINCHLEDEIYNAIHQWSDRKKLANLGEKAEKWVRKHHDIHTANFSEFILRICLVGELEWPRKDLAYGLS